MMRTAVVALIVCLISCGKSQQELEAAGAKLEQQRLDAEARKEKAAQVAEEAARTTEEASQLAAQKDADSKLVAKLQGYVTSSLKDPVSAQFADIRLNPSKDALCGRVNSKNAFGGYVGFREFVSTEDTPVKSVPVWIDSDDELESVLYKEIARRKKCID